MKMPAAVPENISHSFCAAKWLMVTMHFGMGENHSCYHPPIHAWNKEEVEACPAALHNTKHKIEQRRQMLAGEKPAECYYCFNIEDVDQYAVTDRKRFTNEIWAQERLLEILASPPDAMIAPAYLELSFANTCNFACSYCSPGQSSRWEADVTINGSYPVDDRTVNADCMHDMMLENNNPYIDAFWKWLPDVYQSLRYLRITGGEPLVTTNFIKLLDYIADNNNPNLTLVVNTNLCVPDANLNLFFEKASVLLKNNAIKGIEVYTSIDTWGSHAEYIRDGLDVEQWKAAVYKVHATFNVPIRIMVTFGVLSVFNFKEFIAEIIEMKDQGIDVMFNCAVLTDPKHFDIRALPDEFDKYFQDVNSTILSYQKKLSSVEIDTWKIIFSYWTSRKETMSAEDRAWRLQEFKSFVAEYDRRRNKNFDDVFPGRISEFFTK